MHRRVRDLGGFCLLFAVGVGCDRPASTSPSASPPDASPSGTTVPVPSVITTASGAASVTAQPPPPPAPRDPEMPPTPGEWASQGRAVVVTGAGEFACRAAMIDTWLRVACQGEGKQKPVGVEVTRGGGDGMTFAITKPGATSLVLPFVEGVNVGVAFAFSGAEATLRVSWPRGSAEPEAKGEMAAKD